MTDEKNDNATPQPDNKADEPEFPEGIIPQLRPLIKMANGTSFRGNAPVTVLVKGVQVSGLVIGAKEAQKWFVKTNTEANANATITFNDGPPTPEQAEEARGVFRKIADEDLPKMLERIDKSPPARRYNFLYLKNARVWSMGREPLRPEVFVIRLDQIDAFMLGEPKED
jgi:hypothetical protein